MDEKKLFTLPKLPYEYNASAPYISEEQLKLHHLKHHQGYVTGANTLLEKLDKARRENAELDVKATLKELSFQVGGYKLHTLFWENLAPANKGGGGAPRGDLAKGITEEFGKFERFKKEFTQAATSVEGSGWAALSFMPKSGILLIMQIEKHNVNVYPGFRIPLVLDVWEHAYYLDYRNDRGKFVESFWNIVKWDEVSRRLEMVKKQ